ncbi:MAG: ABC transporter six-transmembrane domain-containing protein [Bacteroidota bacterium]
MAKFDILRNLFCKHKYQLFITYALFTIETIGGLLRFYFFGEAVNDLIKGSYNGLIILATVHLIYLSVGTIRHMYDTRTYSAIYTSLVTGLLSRRINKPNISKMSAHSTLAKEFVDFLEQDLVYVLEAFYNLAGSLIILFFYDKKIALLCLGILIPVMIVSYAYGKRMNRLNKERNDELEKQVDVISTGNKIKILNHYNNLRKWQIKISNKEALNFGFMELMVLVVITVSLIVSKNLHSSTIMAGSLFGIYSYILKFTAGLDTIPYTVQRISSLNDIAKRIEFEEENAVEENHPVDIKALPYLIPTDSSELKKIA